MMKEKNKNYIDYVREVFDYFERNGWHEGEGGPYFQMLDGKRGPAEIKRSKFLKLTVSNLILTGYLEMKDPRFICLTQKGYDYVQGGVFLCNTIDLLKFVDLRSESEKQFNLLWDIIGNDKTALFYVKGSLFYELASSILEGLPSSYTSYLISLDKQKQSRSIWYRNFYLGMSLDQRKIFLQGLSDIIANEYEEFYPFQQTDESDEILWAANSIEENERLSENMEKEKKNKIFISHSSADKKVVEALVDLLIIIGVNKPEQMFCSSCPPFDVKVNNDIFATLKEQYDKYHLYMIYMLSDNYYNSPVSLNEMGAGWVLQYDYQCITLPGFSPNDIKGCVDAKKKALVLDSETLRLELNDFIDEIVKLMKLPPIDPKLLETKKDRFISAIK